MKVRTGHVSNSSSSSFVLNLKKPIEEMTENDYNSISDGDSFTASKVCEWMLSNVTRETRRLDPYTLFALLEIKTDKDIDDYLTYEFLTREQGIELIKYEFTRDMLLEDLMELQSLEMDRDFGQKGEFTQEQKMRLDELVAKTEKNKNIYTITLERIGSLISTAKKQFIRQNMGFIDDWHRKNPYRYKGRVENCSSEYIENTLYNTGFVCAFKDESNVQYCDYF